jgi:hypothetical protein
MNLFYRINLQAFNVISIVFYHGGPTFGQVLYSCLDAFVVDASDYSGHLIRHLLNASESVSHGVVSSEQVKVWWAQLTRLPVLFNSEVIYICNIISHTHTHTHIYIYKYICLFFPEYIYLFHVIRIVNCVFLP